MDRALAGKIGGLIRTARQGASLTQAELAEELGISNEVYARFERGRNLPRLTTVLKLCAALEVSSDVLLGVTRGRGAPHGAGSRELVRLLRSLSKLNDRSLSLLRLLIVELAKAQPKSTARRDG